MTRMISMMVGGLLMISATAPAKSKTTKRAGNRAVVAYTLSTCQDCIQFKQWLRQAGVRLTTVQTRESPVSVYPTVMYSDGRSDHGERLYSRQVSLPRSLKVVEKD